MRCGHSQIFALIALDPHKAWVRESCPIAWALGVALLAMFQEEEPLGGGPARSVVGRVYG